MNKINKDYLYCLNEDTCDKRKGCKRWICNYPEEYVIQESNDNIYGYIDDWHCMLEDYNYDNAKHPFDMFDGWKIKP